MRKIQIEVPLDTNIINWMNAESEYTIFVLNNTKGLRIENLKRLNSNVVISITGGLNPKKEKFKDEYYQERTYYSPAELISIISIFEKVERMIDPSWNELEKCMFVYKKICEYSNYSENNYNGRDASRNLLGLITGKSVCSGYAIIFKEAMDRLGIKCYYQNKQRDHSWNIVELDGELHAIELTWDVYSKSDNTCKFKNFCRSNKEAFYTNAHHDISNEPEEREYDVKAIPFDKLCKTLQKVSTSRVHRKKTSVVNGIEGAAIASNNIIIVNDTPYLNGYDSYNTFIRSDNSSFLIIPTDKSIGNVNEYIYLEYLSNSKEIKAAKIYSEMNLITGDNELRDKIVGSLLSKHRISQKIRNFNGYVGYVEKGCDFKYYNQDFEESLGIYR